MHVLKIIIMILIINHNNVGTYLEQEKRVFNYRLSRARRVIENTFGILATKFRIFRRSIVAKPEKVTKVTQAACDLHNFLKISEAVYPISSHVYCPPGFTDREDRKGNLIPGDWRTQGAELRPIRQAGSNMYCTSKRLYEDLFQLISWCFNMAEYSC